MDMYMICSHVHHTTVAPGYSSLWQANINHGFKLHAQLLPEVLPGEPRNRQSENLQGGYPLVKIQKTMDNHHCLMGKSTISIAHFQ
jgi:hypothetical protein